MPLPTATPPPPFPPPPADLVIAQQEDLDLLSPCNVLVHAVRAPSSRPPHAGHALEQHLVHWASHTGRHLARSAEPDHHLRVRTVAHHGSDEVTQVNYLKWLAVQCGRNPAAAGEEQHPLQGLARADPIVGQVGSCSQDADDAGGPGDCAGASGRQAPPMAMREVTAREGWLRPFPARPGAGGPAPHPTPPPPGPPPS